MIVRRYKLNIDAGLLQTLNGQAINIGQPTGWTLRDSIVVGIDVIRRVGGVEQAVPVTGVTQYRLMVKQTSDLTETPLVDAPTASWNQVADWADVDPSAGKIGFRASLAGEGLIALFDPNSSHVDLVGEIELRDSEDRAYTLCRFGVRVYQDVIQGGEAGPTLTTSDIRYVEVDGKIRIAYLFEDDNWYAMVPAIIDGTPSHHWQLYEDPE